MSSRRTTQNVSLFPFLAVLVCAMGSLILLLLLATKRISELARQESLPPVLALPEEPAASIVPNPQESLDPSTAEQNAVNTAAGPNMPEPPAVRPLFSPPEEPAKPVPRFDSNRRAWELYEQAFRDYKRRQQELDAAWLAKVTRLRREREDHQRQLQEETRSVASRQRQRADLRKKVQQKQASLRAVQSEREDLRQGANYLRTKRLSLGKELDAAEAKLQQLLTKQRSASRRQTIVPIDSLTGTTRRAIVLECRASEIVFVSEGVRLTPRDLHQFIPHYNPLAAGVQALFEYWKSTDQTRSEPYVLLIVRPEGTVSYYIARMFLESTGIPFGYELVTKDQELTWPESPEAAQEVCRRAVTKALRNRSQMRQLAGPQGRRDESVSVLGRDGTFQLEEVERLRKPGRMVRFGAQSFPRSQGMPSESSARSSSRSFRKQPATGAADSSSRRLPEQESKPSRPAMSNWQSSALGGGIAVQREVTIRVSKNAFTLANQPRVQIDLALADLGTTLSTALDVHVRQWGSAPKGFYWKPRIEFIVHPNATETYARMKSIVDRWSLDSSVKYVVD